VLEFVSLSEKEMGTSANHEFLPMQPGEVIETYVGCANLRGRSASSRVRRSKRACAGLCSGFGNFTISNSAEAGKVKYGKSDIGDHRRVRDL
jgi:hypothetical protein